MIKIGVIGCGNMGGAILRAWASKPELDGQMLFYAYDRNPERCACGISRVDQVNSEIELARIADLILLAVKPHQLPDILSKIKKELDGDKVLVSIAAGTSIARIKELCGKKIPVVRVMPNIPALVGQGIFGICFDDPALSDANKELIQQLFSSIGESMIFPEGKFNAFTALSGGGPAYVYYFLDALIESGVSMGITRQESRQIVLAMVKGSVALTETTEQPMTLLREQVCSPGGTTIEATNHFDRKGVRGHIIDGVALACEKGKKLE